MRYRPFILGLLLLGGIAALAQRGGFLGGGEIDVPEGTRTAREVGTRNDETPNWTNAPTFEHDVLTFARVRYDKRSDGRRGGGGWTTDLPDADLNLSFRLQQMTSLRLDPDGRLVRLTDPELVNFPFLFLSAAGSLYLTPPEMEALRKHLLNGGFLLIDDFWGDSEWGNCEDVFREVFPDRSFVELPLDHPVYHGVFEIKTKAQVANVRVGIASERNGVTWENNHDGDVRTVHHRGISDDKGRLMVMALHNTDTADGWEREGESDYYFHNFSEKIAYPLGVNIIFYTLTH
ncbi:MAG: hypothetical protein RIS76_2917 [Verrucomicrobiota bacterium]|jgi:Domain of unknown function (DUF4159)